MHFCLKSKGILHITHYIRLSRHIYSGTTNLTFLKKIKNPDPVMGAKLNSKTHLRDTIFDCLSRFGRVKHQSLQKVQIWAKKKCSSKMQCEYKKTQNLTLISNPLKMLQKNAHKKVISKPIWHTWVKFETVHISVKFLLITFLWEFFLIFFNGFEISVKFCVF